MRVDWPPPPPSNAQRIRVRRIENDAVEPGGGRGRLYGLQKCVGRNQCEVAISFKKKHHVEKNYQKKTLLASYCNFIIACACIVFTIAPSSSVRFRFSSLSPSMCARRTLGSCPPIFHTTFVRSRRAVVVGALTTTSSTLPSCFRLTSSGTGGPTPSFRGKSKAAATAGDVVPFGGEGERSHITARSGARRAAMRAVEIIIT